MISVKLNAPQHLVGIVAPEPNAPRLENNPAGGGGREGVGAVSELRAEDFEHDFRRSVLGPSDRVEHAGHAVFVRGLDGERVKAPVQG